MLVLAIRVVRAVPVLSRLHVPDPLRWPSVSLVIPARDEAASIEAAVRSRLVDDYPALQVVLVDDRSTDGTSAIVDRLAATDPRVEALHIRELPADWIGKVHALQRGTEVATGEWLLYSDADVHAAPGTLRRCIAYALERDLDHVAVLPELWRTTFILDVVLATFVRVLCIGARFWSVHDSRSSAAMGVGAFNLVRRSAYERTAGFRWLKLEVVDDAALGQMLKQAGARAAILNGRGCLGLHWYSSLADMARGGEKSVFSGLGQFSLIRLLTICTAVLLLELSPLPALWPLGLTWLTALGAAGTAAALAAQAIPWLWLNGRVLPVLLFPLAAVLGVSMTLRAGILAVWRGGLLWRGTLYPLKMLRAGARLKFP